LSAGVTQLVTGSVVYPALLRLLNNDEDLAWRWALVVPSILAVGIAGWFYHFSDDCPLGNFEQVKKAGLMVERSAVDSFRSGVYNLNSWILFIQYAGSCGVDFTMSNGTAIYYQAQFRQSTAVSGAIAFLYGLSAVFARGAGGWLSDKASDKFALQGRLWAQLLCMTLQGVTNIWLARTKVFADTLPILVIFSIFVQMSMGCCYGIVPYVDGPNTGSVAGVVGAGGSIGAALLALMFMSQDYDASMEWMGWFTIFTAIFTPLIIVKGYRGLVFGSDDSDDAASRQQHSPLMVPGKLHRSPHLVSLHARRQQLRR
jgi:MFS transporter, NNP family, nitrate/nitrite transporter